MNAVGEHFSGSFVVPVPGFAVLSFSRSGVQGEATPKCMASAVVWNIPLGFSNDLLMALMSLHRGALLHMGLLEKRKGGRARGCRKVNIEIGRRMELDLCENDRSGRSLGRREGKDRKMGKTKRDTKDRKRRKAPVSLGIMLILD